MRIAAVAIEPIIKERVVPLALDEAFRLFTTRMGEWWPLATHSIGETEAATIRFEPIVGGRITEILPDGTEHPWADVLAWDPPERFVVSWHPTVSPEAASMLEVRFRPVPGGTALHLEHRGWEEFGQRQGQELREGYAPGWDIVLGGFTTRADSGVGIEAS